MIFTNNLKELSKKIAYWTLPPGVQELIRITRNGANNSSHSLAEKLLLERNRELRDRHKGERCFILATGPSIREENLTGLKDELCIGVSQFFLHPDIQIINPKYHVLAPNHPPFNFNDLSKIFEGLSKSYSQNMNYFFSHTNYEYSIYNFLQKFPQYQNKNIYYINYANSQQLNEKNYQNESLWDISKSPFVLRTVIYTAIQVALYMGCQKIYLLGCDHDYLQDMNRVTNHHFYKEEDGISDVEHLSSFTTEKWFGEYYFRWQQYRLMREYAQTKGCKIFNATQGGMLDVFPRVQLKDILSKNSCYI
jgi:Protein of unknown function DUF115